MNSQTCFKSTDSYPNAFGTGYSRYSLTSADFDGDNIIDMAVTNYTGSVTILTGMGSGTFSETATYPVSSVPWSIATADFNNDGKPDLATTAPNKIGILINNGLGVFAPPVYIPCTCDSRSLISADFNGDGNADIAFANYSSHNVGVLMGAGTGSFSAAVYYATGWNAFGVAASDFNSDGKMDLAVSNYGANNVSILLGSPSGTFSPAVNYAIGNAPRLINCNDFNSDGKMDLAVANNSSNNVSVLMGNGSGSFSTVTNYSVGSQPYSVASADFNGDHKIDLAVSNSGGFDITVLLNNGIGGFGLPTNYVIGQGPGVVISADLNSDGKSDLASANISSNNVGVRLNGLPVISINTASVCIGNSYTFTPSGANTYTYSSGTAIVTPTISTTYTIIGTGNYSCTNTVSCLVTVNSLPTLTIASTGSICEFSSAVVSVSGANTYSWSTGATTSSITVSPTVNTSYTVTGTDLNNCTNTASSLITVNSLPVLTIASTGSICEFSSAVVSVSGANTYSWSTGATTSSITVSPTVNTSYTVTGTDLNTCSATQTVAVTIDQTCQDVWPGDANSDGVADNFDVLELGLHYTQTGPARAATSNVWQSYFSSNWVGSISNGKNVNHSDCNGDGVIDNNDTLAIFNNYGLTYAFKPTEPTVVNPQLSIIPDQSAVAKGNWGTASLFLGEASAPVTNINGLAFTVTFDQSLIEPNSFYIEYPVSFINAGNQNLKFSKPDFANGKLYTATTHTVTNNVSGNGKIAVLHYRIKSNLATDEVLNIGITQAQQSNASGALTPLTAGSATVAAIGASVGMNELSNGNTISVYPNPANSLVTIHSSSTLEKIELLSITGQLILSQMASGNQHQIDLTEVANGVYFIIVYGADQKVTRKKIAVQH